MRPLRIAFVAYRGNMQCGGQGVYLWSLARELARLGHEIDVFVGPPYPDPMSFARRVTHLPNEQFWGKWFMRDAAALLPRPQPLSIFHPLNFYELAASRLGFLPEPLAFSLRAFAAVASAVRRGERYDVVHDVQCLGFGVLGIRALGVPVVTTVHHPLTLDRRASFVRDRSFRDALGTMMFYPVGMQSLVARRIERVFTSSRVSADWIERDFGVAPDRICMVANGVDTDFYTPDDRVARNPMEILCVGRASDPNKGIETLIDALTRLPREAQLTLVDSDHPDSEARRRARALGVEDRLSITGRVSSDQLLHLYRRAAVVAVPSRFEGFGLPAVEAMACGTPVVASAAGALPEVVGTGGGGILVQASNPEALASGLGTLLADPARRAALGASARARVTAAYAWPRVARATSDVYDEVVREWRGRPARTTTSASPGARRATASSASSAA